MSRDKFNTKKYKRLIEAKGAMLPCPRCEGKGFVIVNGYANREVRQYPNETTILGGETMPYITVYCNQCGFMSNHAIGILEEDCEE